VSEFKGLDNSARASSESVKADVFDSRQDCNITDYNRRVWSEQYKWQ